MNQIYGRNAVACKVHMTDEDRAAAARQAEEDRAKWRAEWAAGAEERERERVAREAERLRKFPIRLTDEEGRQLVVVDGKLSWRWDREDLLVVGDKVVVPETPYSDARVGTVTSLGTDYQGYVRPIVARAG
jgi:hypothetical protein